MKEKSKLILLINTTLREEIVLGLISVKTKMQIFQTLDQSKDLLVLIDRFIKDLGYTKNDLEAILVNIGPGSYTGVRVGATVGDTLAWSLDIPVFGYLNDNLDQTIKKAQLAPKKFTELALPTYLNVS